jgi:hypothetical protein
MNGAPYSYPGVYREEVFPKPEPKLPTGVAGFVGFAKLRADLKRAVQPGEPVLLHHREDFGLYFEFEPREDRYLAEAITGFFLNGGVRCYIACVDPHSEPIKALKAFQDAVALLAPLHDLDLIAVPDAVSLPEENLYTLQAWLLVHCAEQGDRLALLDTLRGRPPKNVDEDRKRILAGDARPAAMWGALYYPWVKVKAMADLDRDRWVPPCGHVAGIYARTDAKVGVFKAPANEEVIGALDLDSEVDNDTQGELNPLGINCLRSFPGRGIRLWGARTLSDDARWRYVNVRRLFITVRRWIDLNMSWAVFEPNTPQLWMRIERELRSYLSSLWQVGALQGRTPEEAFYVRCDAETNPPDGPADRLVTELGLAPTAPAEFVVVRIVHRPSISPSGGEEGTSPWASARG